MAKYQELDTAPKDPEVAEAVSFDSVEEAKEGIEKIEKMYNKAGSRSRRVYLKMAIHMLILFLFPSSFIIFTTLGLFTGYFMVEN